MSPLHMYVVRNLMRRPFLSALVLGMVTLTGVTTITLATLGYSLRASLIQRALPNRLFAMSENAREETESQVPANILSSVILVPGAKAWTENLNYILRSGASGPEAVMVRGLDQTGFTQRGASLVEGTMPARGEREVIMGETVRGRYPDYTIGSTVRLGNHPWRVVGYFKTGTFDDSEAWTSREALGAEFHSGDNVNVIVIDLADVSALEQQRNNIKAMPNAKLTLTSDIARKQSVYDEFGPLYTVLVAVAILVLFGAMLSVMMALSLVFSQRTAELSALRAIGLRNMAIGRLVLFESNTFALIGAAVALVVSLALLHERTTYSGSFAFKMLLRPEIFIASAMATILACSLGAIIPLRRVLRLDIPQGLRED